MAEYDRDRPTVFRGRLKQIIIRAGSNISPQEVEEILYQHPAVFEAGVVGKPDPEFARQRLADYKTPETVVILPELPKGLTGKVLRRALKEMLAAGRASA